MDRLTPEERSKNMAAIRSKNTKPEILMRKWLFSKGFRFRVNVTYIPGHPDIFLRKYNTAMFVHGCFWHRHEGCKYAYIPKSRLDFWEYKFQKNIERDRKVKNELYQVNIKCLIVWECTINQMKRQMEYNDLIMEKIEQFLHNDCLYLEL